MALFTAEDYEALPPGLYVGKLLDIESRESANGEYRRWGWPSEGGDDQEHVQGIGRRPAEMKREYRQPTRSEWERITSSCPIVRRVVLRRTNLTRDRDERLNAPKGGGG